MQSASTVLMIRPKWFGANAETALSNAFQKNAKADLNDILLEFDQVVFALQNEGVEVIVYQDIEKPRCPDAIFPNNWLGVHPGKQLVVYPMMAINRRQERRKDIIEDLLFKYRIPKPLDLSKYENNGEYLEGTGSIVYDHINKIAYAALSPRTHQSLAKLLNDVLGYKLVCFRTKNFNGSPIYHTNVLLSIGSEFAVVAKELIEPDDQEVVLNSLNESGRSIIEITNVQAFSFAANILELTNKFDERLLVISNKALDSLNAIQVSAIQKSCLLVPVSVDLIEQIGGGGVRCMLTEIFI